MRLQRLLIGVTAVAAVAACSSPQPSEMPSQASSGPGWRLTAQRANGSWPSLRVTPLSGAAVTVAIVVAPGCPNGGAGTPTFVGFSTKGDVVAAVVSRTSITGASPCVAEVGTEFDVQLDLRALPPSVQTMILGGQACPTGDDSCAPVTAPLPVQGRTSTPKREASTPNTT
jgi:septal ring-binding cell division protein DamX